MYPNLRKHVASLPVPEELMMKARNVLNRCLEGAITVFGKWIGSLLLGISIVAVFISMLFGVADVVATKVGIAFPGPQEIIEYSLPIMVIAGITYLQLTGTHIALDIVSSRVSRAWRLRLDILTYVCGFVACALLAWRTVFLFRSAIESKLLAPGSINLPLYPAYFLIMFSFIVAALVELLLVIRSVVHFGESSRQQETKVVW
jgi:TRAP-type C4-dicarboxylate transport system permease small subunit